MNRWIVPLAALLGGCIIYDTKGPSDGPGGGYDDEPDHDTDGRPDDDTDGRPDEDDTGSGDNGGDTAPNDYMKMTLEPDSGAAGTTFIAHLDSDRDDFDWSTVTSVTFFGDVEVLAMDEDGGELDLAIRILADAAPGDADMLVETADGQAFFQYDALTVLAAE